MQACLAAHAEPCPAVLVAISQALVSISVSATARVGSADKSVYVAHTQAWQQPGIPGPQTGPSHLQSCTKAQQEPQPTPHIIAP